MTQAWLQKVSAEYYNNYDSAVNVGRPGCREFLQNIITFHDSAENFGRNLNLNNNQNLLQKIDFLHNFIFEINLIILFLQTFILRCFD